MLRERMPRKGRDPGLDGFLLGLGLADSRGYASGQWAQFSGNNGIYPPPIYDSNIAELFRGFQDTITATLRKKVINQAISCAKEIPYNPRVVSPALLQGFLVTAKNIAITHTV
jgi:hypothetical protein